MLHREDFGLLCASCLVSTWWGSMIALSSYFCCNIVLVYICWRIWPDTNSAHWFVFCDSGRVFRLPCGIANPHGDLLIKFCKLLHIRGVKRLCDLAIQVDDIAVSGLRNLRTCKSGIEDLCSRCPITILRVQQPLESFLQMRSVCMRLGISDELIVEEI